MLGGRVGILPIGDNLSIHHLSVFATATKSSTQKNEIKLATHY